MNEFSFEGLNVFAKFCWNQVDEEMFAEMMKPKYHDAGYIREKWLAFYKDPFMFIIAREERVLYQNILDEIKRTGYNG